MNIRIACCAAASIASAASASIITGVAANTSFVGANGEYCQLDLYITFSQDFYRLGAVYDSHIALSGVTFADCIHHDTGELGGTWAPQSTLDPIDSFVTLGTLLGPTNSTAADPLWGPRGFDQVGIPDGAGWFNSYPNNFEGQTQLVTLFNTAGEATYSGWAVLAASFVVPKDLASGATLSFSSGCQWLYALDIFGFANVSGTFEFAPVPAPGAAVVLALSGIRGSRRRNDRSSA
ncbi:MAG: hypothetical protein U0572_12870 [Phycisphaerales bacterium]